MYLCPICQHSLTQNDKQYLCLKGHSFDIAREGYVNLLPVQQKNSKDPGDNKEMMSARRHFLQGNWYAPLSYALNEHLTQLKPQSLLDLGCGEGYYTATFKQHLPDTHIYGLDISKIAVKFAAKAYSDIKFCVASAFQLPFENSIFDAVVRIYAPSKADELTRVIKQGGHLITVTPGPSHLVQIKQAVYDSVRLHSDKIESLEGFTHLKRNRLEFNLTFTEANDLIALIQMVPLAWKFTQEQKLEFAQKLPTISIDFLIDIFEKH